jgi:hypothetical protein
MEKLRTWEGKIQHYKYTIGIIGQTEKKQEEDSLKC